MSIEKFFALYFPLKVKTICTVRTAKWVCLITGLIFFTFDSQFFFIIDAHVKNGYDVCNYVYPNYELIFNRIDATFYSFAPFTIMIAANLAIIYKFMKAKWNSRNPGIIPTESTHQAMSKAATKGTLMLVTVSIAFIVLTAPISIAYTITEEPHPMVDAITVILDYLNHSINAVLYCISGTRFRGELMKTLGCHKKNKVGNFTSSMTNNVTATASPIEHSIR